MSYVMKIAARPAIALLLVLSMVLMPAAASAASTAPAAATPQPSALRTPEQLGRQVAGRTQLSAGESHTCATIPDGTARCWGLNTNGQLGDGSSSQRPLPVTIGGTTPLSTVVSVSAGNAHTCAVLADGTARCWGHNGSGRLGDGSTTGSLTPVVVGGATPLTGIVDITTGGQHSCALLTDGTARCWGLNDNGRLGDGSTTASPTPVVVGGTTPLTSIVAIDTRGAHTCAVIADSTARCWGAGGAGQLGDGTALQRLSPTTVGGTTVLTGVVAIETGGQHSCALLTDGTARCWGGNTGGQLGDGSTAVSSVPAVVGGGSPLTGIVGMSVGSGHSCALLTDGTARCWGSNTGGQLGDGSTTDGLSPVVVGSPSQAGLGEISAGGQHSCALLASGTARCWGRNTNGQLGDGSTTDRATPDDVGVLSAPAGVATQLGLGDYHGCAAIGDGTARCWGNGTFGRLGNAGEANQPIPVEVGGATQLTEVVAVSGGNAHSCALLADSTARCWGSNTNGRLGDGTTTASSTPVVVGGATPLTRIVTLSTGTAHTCALLADGTARCWGANGLGQLGNGTTADSLAPVVVGGSTPLTGIVALSAAGLHACALLTDSTVRCWGSNVFQQLGNGTGSSSLPIPVGGGSPLSGVVAISAGISHTCAVLADSTARCWGENDDRQLGDGTTTGGPTPVVVGGATPLTRIVMISPGLNHSCALLADGSARCWGANAEGQLGNGTTTASGAPVTVGGATPLRGIVEINASVRFTCALLADGTVRCWGTNDVGQLGNGSTTNRSTPVRVLLTLPTLTITGGSVIEGTSFTTTASLVFTATLSFASGITTTAQYATSNATAFASSDYIAQNGTLSFAPGQTTRTITIAIQSDPTYELDEQVRVTLSNPSHTTIETGSAFGTILNDDPIPSFSVSGATVMEGNSGTTTLGFWITLSASSGTTATIQYATVAGSAINGEDYTPISGTITFQPTLVGRLISVTVKTDDLYEYDETLTMVLSNATGATIATSSATGTIQNDDAMPTLYPQANSVTEGDSGAQEMWLWFHLSTESGITTTVDYATSGGTATPGEDYTPISGTITFAPGEVELYVPINVLGDTAYELTETIGVTISNLSGAAPPPYTTAHLILDDDAPPSISIAGGSVAEGDSGTSTMVFTATLSAVSGVTATVQYATSNGTATGGAGQDYTAQSGSVTFLPGQISRPISIPIRGETRYENDETLLVTLSSPSEATLATSIATGTIQNDDAVPSFSVSEVAVAEGNSDTSGMMFMVELSAASEVTATISYAVVDGTARAGEDYTPMSGTLTFPPATMGQSLTVIITSDVQYETAETLMLVLSNPTNASIATGSATGTIQNDDAMPSLALSGGSTMVEGASGTTTMPFTVTLSAASNLTTTVQYATGGTATAGVDYIAISGTLTFAPGQTTKVITLAISGDKTFEVNETVDLVLSNPSSASISAASASGTIVNDDAVPAIAISGGSAVEGHSGTRNIPFTLMLTNPSDFTTTVQYATSNGTALAGNDYVAISGTITFAPGETVQTISVQVTSDEVIESDETMSITLSNPSGATLGTASATGTILNDDQEAGPAWQMFMPLVR